MKRKEKRHGLIISFVLVEIMFIDHASENTP